MNTLVLKFYLKTMEPENTHDYEHFLLNFLSYHFQLNKGFVPIYVVTEECLYDSENALYNENGVYKGIYRDMCGGFLSDIEAIMFLNNKKDEDKNDDYKYSIKQVELEKRLSSEEDKTYELVFRTLIHPSYNSITIEKISKFLYKNKNNIRTLTI